MLERVERVCERALAARSEARRLARCAWRRMDRREGCGSGCGRSLSLKLPDSAQHVTHQRRRARLKRLKAECAERARAAGYVAPEVPAENPF